MVGLGNPGPRFSETRHNVGFMLLRLLAEQHHFVFRKKLFAPYLSARSNLGVDDGRPLTLIEPLTYMNRSGIAVRKALLRNRAEPEATLIVCDTLDLAPGRIRLRRGGSSAGHNGLKSVIEETGSSDFMRLYVGIGRPPKREEVVDYVLGEFPPEERHAIDRALSRGATALRELLTQPFEAVTNAINSRT
ncbi:MAG: aminoacyl-tRNA hydrolase [Spirochaetaceae bacterium]